MQMPVIVGMIVATMFLVTFSGWFYNYALGMEELVLDDKFFSYRIVAASLVSAVFFVMVFFVISIVNQCPNQERVGIFAGLKCEQYLKLKASADNLFQPKNETVNQAL
ncbi:MAG: hypothetical protein AAB973_01165 [Patescibacteria group bacterium]